MKAVVILTVIAAHHSHGYSGDRISLEQQEAALTRGERIVNSCGTISQIGIRAAQQAGFKARLVATITREPYNGVDDGHVMLEVRLSKGWTLFDLDGNRRSAAGIGIHEQVRRPQWQTIAHDPLYEESEATPLTRQVFADLTSWDRRILGVPMIEAGGKFWLRDRNQFARIEASYPGNALAGKKRWRELIAESRLERQ